MTATAKEVWDTLSKIDVSKKIEKKAGLSYLSWAWAWGELMKAFPESNYRFLPDEIRSDGTVTVNIEMTVEGITRSMWLPVMDNRNNAVENPNARKISDAKMRCLVKCIAMFGLGHYIYAGEDLPEGDDKPTAIASDHDQSVIADLILATETDAGKFCGFFGIKSLTQLPAEKVAQAKSMLESKLEKAK